MAINVNDDYEKLAKLLYPSIEASGNTYYGQTRKLTLDEVFDKNGNGFESHIESIRVPDTSSDSGFKYDVLFKWKVGPLSGSLNADTQYNTDTWFAVYEIVQDPITNENLTYSGEFNSYEYNTHAVFKRVMSTNGKNPVNLDDDYDGRNFYVAKDGIKNYIYVLLRGRFIENAPEDLNIEGIKLTAKNGPVNIGLRAVGQIDSANYASFKYKLQNDTAWNSLNLFVDDVSGTTINLQADEYVLIKRLPNKVKDYNTDRYVQFMFGRPEGSNGTIDVSGDMLYMAKDQSSYSAQLDIFEFAYLFRGCTLLTSAPKLPFTNLNVGCYYNMFRGCTSIEYPPELPATTLAETCYSLMFSSCTSLKRTPILAANNLVDGCYMQMFQGCSNLNYAECYAKVNSGNMTTAGWMDGISNTGTFITNEDTVLSEDSYDGIPAGWNHITQELPINQSANEDNITVLKTNGCDYVGNGRGDVSNPSTINNMEKSFDEHNLHQMNTYNIDGSLNQEVWGYKCFNSPVQFRNGIYGEQSKLVTTHEIKDNVVDPYPEHIENKGSKLSSYNNADNISSNVTVLNTSRVVSSSDNSSVVRDELGGCASLVAGDINYINIFNNNINGTIVAASYNNIRKYDSNYGEYYDGEESDIILKAKSNSDYYSTIRVNSSEEQTPGELIHETYVKLESNAINNGNKSYIKIEPDNIYLNSNSLNIGDYNDSFKINVENYNIQTKCNILPSVNNANLGSSDHIWSTVYTTDISCSGDIGSDDAKVDNIYANELFANTIRPYFNGYASSCIGYKHNGSTLVIPYKEAYITNVYIRSTQGVDSSLIFSNDSKIKLKTNTETGDKEAYARDLVTGVDYNNGNDGGINISSLNGLINPKPITMKRLIADVSRDRVQNISISNGSLVMAFIKVYDDDLTVSVGKYINFNFNDQDPTACGYLAKCNGGNSYVQTSDQLPEGCYVAFCDVDIPANTTSKLPILLMKVT